MLTGGSDGLFGVGVQIDRVDADGADFPPVYHDIDHAAVRRGEDVAALAQGAYFTLRIVN